MNLAVAAIKVNLVAASLPRPLFLEVYALYYSFEVPSEEPQDYSLLLEYIDSDMNEVIRKTQIDFAPISQRIGVILDTVVEPFITSIQSRQLLHSSDILSSVGTTSTSDTGQGSVVHTRMINERLLMDTYRCSTYFGLALQDFFEMKHLH